MAVQSSSRNNRCQSFQHSNDLFRSRSTGDERDDEEAAPSPVVRTIPPCKSAIIPFRGACVKTDANRVSFCKAVLLKSPHRPPPASPLRVIRRHSKTARDGIEKDCSRLVAKDLPIPGDKPPITPAIQPRDPAERLFRRRGPGLDGTSCW